MMAYNGPERRTRNPWPALAFVLLAFFAGYANFKAYENTQKNRELIAQIGVEGKERRHQICLSAEREHLSKVNRLSAVYRFLSEASAEERDTALYKVVKRDLPQTEAEAKYDVAPEFCDELNVGLPEPDPLIPNRPPGLYG